MAQHLMQTIVCINSAEKQVIICQIALQNAIDASRSHSSRRKSRNGRTVRLCLQVGRKFDLPWVKKLAGIDLPKGGRSRWVARSKDGLLVLKP